MEKKIKIAIEQYVNSQLTFAAMYPQDAEHYKHNAFGAVEFACKMLDNEKAYWTSKELQDQWINEWVNLFDQMYK